MFSIKTEIINTTGSNVTLKEENAGVITRTVGTLKRDGGSLTVGVHSNATYTLFKCVQDVEPPAQDIPPIPSDDIADFKEIRIYQKPDKTFSWKGIKRAAAHEQPAGTPRSISGSIFSFFSWLFTSRRERTHQVLPNLVYFTPSGNICSVHRTQDNKFASQLLGSVDFPMPHVYSKLILDSVRSYNISCRTRSDAVST